MWDNPPSKRRKGEQPFLVNHRPNDLNLHRVLVPRMNAMARINAASSIPGAFDVGHLPN